MNFDHLYLNSHVTYDDPITLKAHVVKGFQRGSKELGVPTANLNMDELGERGEQLKTGIYYGWCLLNTVVYKTVVSVGWNPFYHNTKKTVEAHLLANLDDFYGEEVNLLLCGYIRDEANFNSLDELISCINNDISISKNYLETESSSSKYVTIDHWHLT